MSIARLQQEWENRILDIIWEELAQKVHTLGRRQFWNKEEARPIAKRILKALDDAI